MAGSSSANGSAKETKFYTRTSIDDSSDEEDSVEPYDIKDQIEELKQGYDRDCYPYNSSNILSFIGHAVGKSILYSPPVQERYYQLKEEQLQQDPKTVHLLNEEIGVNMEAQFEKVRRFAGNAWKGEKNNREVMNAVFEGIKRVLIPGIIKDKMSYCRNYQKNHLQPLLNMGLDPYLIPNFTSNFHFPFPLKNFTRKTLENVKFDLSAVTQDNFLVEFLARLRLHNRSEKRHTLNHEQCKDTSWRIFKTELKEVVVHVYNQRQLYNEKNKPCYYYRNEQVYLGRNILPTYLDFFSCQTKTQFSILLKNRLNIKKGPDGMFLGNNIVALWYLLFGCEVIRNPAAIIYNNMVLDLAEARYVDEQSQLGYDYQQIIADIPMSEKGSIRQAMELNKCFGYLIRYSYQYNQYQDHVPDQNADKLIKREAKITEKWLEFKLGKAAAKYLITQCVSDNKAVETIWKVIAESFEKWGINVMGKVATIAEAAQGYQNGDIKRNASQMTSGLDRKGGQQQKRTNEDERGGNKRMR